jgi:hypothetical protein
MMQLGLSLALTTAQYNTVSSDDIPAITNPEPGAVIPPAAPFVPQTATFTFPSGDNVTNTSWRIRKVSNNSIAWSDLHDAVNLFSVTVPGSTLEPSTNYRLSVQFFGAHVTTRKATVNFMTGA